MERQRYPSDLKDDEWNEIECEVPASQADDQRSIRVARFSERHSLPDRERHEVALIASRLPAVEDRPPLFLAVGP